MIVMEKYYLVDDGGIYNVIPSSSFDEKGRYIENPQYRIDDFDIVRTFMNMKKAFDMCDDLNDGLIEL